MAKIREATINDIPLLAGIIRASFKDVAERFNLTPLNCQKHPSNCTEERVRNDFTKGVKYFILESNNSPVGCAALENPFPEQCYLERLAVLPDERRKGFGRTLVDHILREAKSLGAEQVGIGIISKQSELKSWYKKIGFVEGETKEFSHLPFLVAFMSYTL